MNRVSSNPVARSTRRKLTIGAAATMLMAAGGGIAYATIPNAMTHVITACYPTAGTNVGKLRVIDAEAGAVCTSTEATLTWNQNGLAFRGAYSNLVAYKVNDLVTANGNTYIALVASTGTPLGNTGTWAIFAAKGAKGTTGATGATGAQGPAGPAGQQGVPGPAGPQGATGLSNYIQVTGAGVLVGAYSETTASVACPTGSVPLGGGETNDGNYQTIQLTDSFPYASGWEVYVNNLSAYDHTVYPTVVCATVG